MENGARTADDYGRQRRLLLLVELCTLALILLEILWPIAQSVAAQRPAAPWLPRLVWVAALPYLLRCFEALRAGLQPDASGQLQRARLRPLLELSSRSACAGALLFCGSHWALLHFAPEAATVFLLSPLLSLLLAYAIALTAGATALHSTKH